jgi:hypothetical protein
VAEKLMVDGGEWVAKHLIRKRFCGVKPESDFQDVP